MDCAEKKFLVRTAVGCFALRFGDRVAEAAADGEASLFDSPAEAVAAVLRCGVSKRGLVIEAVDGAGKALDLSKEVFL